MFNLVWENGKYWRAFANENQLNIQFPLSWPVNKILMAHVKIKVKVICFIKRVRNPDVRTQLQEKVKNQISTMW